MMAAGALTAAQKGPLWWAAYHRDHHRFADTELDVHSPRKGFWWSHVGWILCDKFKVARYERIRDFEKYPELRFLNNHEGWGPWFLAIIALLIAGWPGLLIGFFLSTVLLWHTTFLVNSAAHLWGKRRYQTNDTSRNNWLVAILTGGEGWHNNHHHFPKTARQGFFWWEWDPTFYLLKVLSWVHIVKELRPIPPEQITRNRI